MDEKLLSVIIPVYNAQKTIQKCLHSLLLPEKQMKCLEIIVVDDGSTDQSAAYVHKYIRKYPDCIHMLQKQNGGHGSAVNQGILYCMGKYFKVLDADDWVNTAHLARLLQLLKETDADVVVCGYRICQVQTRTYSSVGVCGMKGQYDLPENMIMDMEQVLRYWKSLRRLFSLHGMIYQTDFYKKTDYQMPEHVSYDDAFFFTVPCSHADKICLTSLQLYIYRTGTLGQSISAQNRVQRIHQMEDVIRSILRTQCRNGEKTAAGREYWYRKLTTVTADYYITAYLRFRNKKQGRKTAHAFTKELKESAPALYDRMKSRCRLLEVMNFCHMSERVLERIMQLGK